MREKKAILVIVTLFSFLVFGITPITLKAQPPLKDLRVIGNSINFSFYTLGQMETGITLTGWTKVELKYQYTSKDPWKLVVYSLEDAIKYEGDASNDIPLNQLEFITTITSTNDASAAVSPTFELSMLDSAPESVLVSGNGLVPPTVVDVNLTITYRLGTPPNIMLNKPGGLYYTALRFLLVEQ
ncbi:MAG TPA: hypothetical protein DIW31_06015 [Bacteroidales bacterium]|nr:hypothetical protein [Bacteroidales bacterium]